MTRRLLALAGLVAAAALAPPPHWMRDTDYMEYAAAARLFLARHNPYDWNELLALQQAHGSRWDKADMMWNPPWVLPAVAPLAGLPWHAGQSLWAVLQLGAVVWSARLFWRLVGDQPGREWLAMLLALLFAPTVILLRLGRIGGFVLLGLAGFAAWRGTRPAAAGAALALTAIKPHLLLPFALLLALDAARSRPSRAAAIWGVGVLGLFTLAATAHQPDIWGHYRAALAAPGDARHYAPADWAPPILAHRVRVGLGAPLWVQFAPSAAATAALAVYWWRRRDRLDWGAELPAVALVSLLTTSYGAWAYDGVLLLPAVLAAAVRIDTHTGERGRLWSMCGFAVLSALAVALVIPVILWAPLVALGYAAARANTPP